MKKTYGQLLFEGNKGNQESADLITFYRIKIGKLIDEFIEDYDKICEGRDISFFYVGRDEEEDDLLHKTNLIVDESAKKAVDALELASVFINKTIAYGQSIPRKISSFTSES